MNKRYTIFKGPGGENLIRLPHQHTIFIQEMIKHGDRQQAYGKAYPNSSEASRKPSACRLYNRPHIKTMIEEGRYEAVQQAYNEWVEECKEAEKDQLLDLHERRLALARIVRGQHTQTKYYKMEGQMMPVITVVDSPHAILRAIEMDAKLEAEFYAKQPKQEKQDKFAPGQFPYKRFVYIGQRSFARENEDLTLEEYEGLIQASLADPEIKVNGAPLTPSEKDAGCYIERDMETGQFETVCPLNYLIEREKKKGTIPAEFELDETDPQESFNAMLEQKLEDEKRRNSNVENGYQKVNTGPSQPADNEHEEKNHSIEPPDLMFTPPGISAGHKNAA